MLGRLLGVTYAESLGVSRDAADWDQTDESARLYVRSSESDRANETAVAIAAGWFGHDECALGGGEEMGDLCRHVRRCVHTYNGTGHDPLLRGYKSRRAKQLLKDKKRSPEWQHLARQFDREIRLANRVLALDEHEGDLSVVRKLRSVIGAYEYHSIKLPVAMSEEELAGVREGARAYLSRLYEGEKLSWFAAGSLMKYVCDTFTHVHSSAEATRFGLLVGHDSTLLALQSALLIDSPAIRLPQFGSMVEVRLYQDTTSASDGVESVCLGPAGEGFDGDIAGRGDLSIEWVFDGRLMDGGPTGGRLTDLCSVVDARLERYGDPAA
ncbi:unnamed protein product [Vitrella brassicaformis CCMP3155]|uniref:Acid phosphatase n=1 Tax=Vitrella brassicaformis (strain CCMP3155) TaxID=1169540 RepID=A0A0G4H2R5_VITBC|nr:unnamed protein product [Vitrella brassicaformis CCMP3155]|eukprot:CEM37789.1 unnamed protein product [Vitrella brassicaformis CCMP3155]